MKFHHVGIGYFRVSLDNIREVIRRIDELPILADGQNSGGKPELEVIAKDLTLIKIMPHESGRVIVYREFENLNPREYRTIFSHSEEGGAKVTVQGDLRGIEEVLVSHYSFELYSLRPEPEAQ